MTSVIESAGVLDAGMISSILLPVDGCIGYFRMFDTLERARRNWVNPDLPATVAGTPTITDQGLGFTSNTNYLDLNLPETASFTWLFACKGNAITSASSPFPAYGGNDSPTDVGSMAFATWNASLSQPAVNFQVGGMVSLALPDPTPTTWRLLAFRCDATTGTQILNLTDGTSGPLTAPSGSRVPISRTLRSGSGAHPSFAGGGFMGIDARFNRSLTLGELATMRTAMAADIKRFNAAIAI